RSEIYFVSFAGSAGERPPASLPAFPTRRSSDLLRGPQGNLLATGADLAAAGLSSFISAQALPTNGTYLLLVRDDEGNQTFSYGLKRKSTGLTSSNEASADAAFSVKENSTGDTNA